MSDTNTSSPKTEASAMGCVVLALVRVPSRARVRVELGVDPSDARRVEVKTDDTSDASMQTVQIVARQGAAVWLVARTHAAVGDGPLRRGTTVELSNPDGVALYFVKPRAEETSFVGAYSLTMFAIATSVLLAMAEGWTYVFVAFDVLFAVLSLFSIRRSLMNRGALSAHSTSASDRS